MSSEDENNQLLIEWMQERGPDDWHRVATNYNWDNGLAPLQWIISQPDCDKATALAIFWMSEPENLFEFSREDEAREDFCTEGSEIELAIANNFRRGFYRRAEILFPADGAWSLDQWRSLEAEQPSDVARTTDEMHQGISGREVEADGEEFQEGYPKVLWPKIWTGS